MFWYIYLGSVIAAWFYIFDETTVEISERDLSELEKEVGPIDREIMNSGFMLILTVLFSLFAALIWPVGFIVKLFKSFK